MQADILNELLKIYTKLPNGVVIFKDKKLYFLNNHLRDILTLGNISIEQSIEIICDILQINRDESKLLNFFTTQKFFSYKTKYIQINSNSFDIYDVIVFTKVDDSVASAMCIGLQQQKEKTSIEDVEIPQTAKDNKLHLKILENLEKRQNLKLTGYVLYKGIPLISENMILKSFKNALVVQVGDKQMICAKVGIKWILKNNSGVIIQGNVVNVDTKKNYIFLDNLKTLKDSFSERELIRYSLEKQAHLSFEVKGVEFQLQVLELSENTLSVSIEDKTILDKLSKYTNGMSAKLELQENILTLKCKVIKHVEKRQGGIKIVFKFTSDNDSASKLKNWLNSRQMTLIKEIKEYTMSLAD